MAGASTSSLKEVLGDKLSQWFRDGQPPSISSEAQDKQVMPVSSHVAMACNNSVCAENAIQLVRCMLHQHVVHVGSAGFLYCALRRAETSPIL